MMLGDDATNSDGTATNLGEMTLFHLTGDKGKDAIIVSGQMLRGSNGAFGGGIYLCDKPSDCKNKAKASNPIFLIRVRVWMGTALEVTNISDRSHRKLKKAGFNSVYAPSVFSTGPEYVVYNHDQVKMVDITNIKTGVVVWTAPLCSCHGCDSPQSAKQGGGFHSHCGNSCRRGKCGHGGSAGGAEGAGPAPCRFFASTGRCKYGSGCRYSHAGGGAGGAAAPVGGQGGQGAPLCPCPGCGRPRCANPHGGYYSHCGNYCRHARCGGIICIN